MTDSPLWQTLLKSALETEEVEITCEECYNLLDLYVDLLVDGANPDEIMPTVQQHLQQCNCCIGAVEAMMVILREAAANQDDMPAN